MNCSLIPDLRQMGHHFPHRHPQGSGQKRAVGEDVESAFMTINIVEKYGTHAPGSFGDLQPGGYAVSNLSQQTVSFQMGQELPEAIASHRSQLLPFNLKNFPYPPVLFFNLRPRSQTSSTAINPERKTPSNVPAPPMLATGAPRSLISFRFIISAPKSVPRVPLT